MEGTATMPGQPDRDSSRARIRAILGVVLAAVLLLCFASPAFAVLQVKDSGGTLRYIPPEEYPYRGKDGVIHNSNNVSSEYYDEAGNRVYMVNGIGVGPQSVSYPNLKTYYKYLLTHGYLPVTRSNLLIMGLDVSNPEALAKALYDEPGYSDSFKQKIIDAAGDDYKKAADAEHNKQMDEAISDTANYTGDDDTSTTRSWKSSSAKGAYSKEKGYVKRTGGDPDPLSKRKGGKTFIDQNGEEVNRQDPEEADEETDEESGDPIDEEAHEESRTSTAPVIKDQLPTLQEIKNVLIGTTPAGLDTGEDYGLGGIEITISGFPDLKINELRGCTTGFRADRPSHYRDTPEAICFEQNEATAKYALTGLTGQAAISYIESKAATLPDGMNTHVAIEIETPDGVVYSDGAWRMTLIGNRQIYLDGTFKLLSDEEPETPSGAGTQAAQDAGTQEGSGTEQGDDGDRQDESSGDSAAPDSDDIDEEDDDEDEGE